MLLGLVFLGPATAGAVVETEHCPNLDQQQCAMKQWDVYFDRLDACRRAFDGTPRDVRICVVGATSSWIAARNACTKSVCRAQIDATVTCCGDVACCLTSESCSDTGECKPF
jgi:hypothetical protein